MYMQLIIYADLVYAEPQALTWHSCTNMEITVKMFLIFAWLQLDNKIKIYTLCRKFNVGEVVCMWWYYL